jgi:tRNA (guanine26-N2/guanine27-N2)-dimethyltransferase
MREWVRQHSPVKETSLKPGTAGATIMAKSRDNLRKGSSEDPWLSQLKSDLLAAVESGKDISDLVTKVEAALYRSGSRQSFVTQAQTADAQEKSAHEPPAVVQVKSASDGPAGQLQVQAHPSTLEVKFDAALGREASAAHSKKRLVRYQLNPRANWGPLNRAAANSK